MSDELLAHSPPVVFIGYPQAFACYPKFERKVARILSSLTNVSVAFVADPRNFVHRFSESGQSIIEARLKLDDPEQACRRCTHAIIFDGDDSLESLACDLQSAGSKVRLVKSHLTTVVNKDKGHEFDLYIGRGSEFGNPYAIGFDGDREEVIRKFAYDFERDFLRGGAEFKARLQQYKGKRLGCHCAPAPCHGDILAEYLNSLDDEL